MCEKHSTFNENKSSPKFKIPSNYTSVVSTHLNCQSLLKPDDVWRSNLRDSEIELYVSPWYMYNSVYYINSCK